jgi:hypothetical protein
MGALFVPSKGKTVMGKIDPLTAWVQQSPVQALIAAAMLLVLCALLVAFTRQRRRLVALQTLLDSLSTDIRRLEVAHEDLLVRFMNLPRRRKVRKSGPSSGTLEASPIAPKQPDEKSKMATLYVVAPNPE